MLTPAAWRARSLAAAAPLTVVSSAAKASASRAFSRASSRSLRSRGRCDHRTVSLVMH